MAWTIACLENSLYIDKVAALDVAKAALKFCPDAFYDAQANMSDDLTLGKVLLCQSLTNGEGFKLRFDPDAMEHMDYLTHNKDFCNALACAGAEGRVLFGSLEGDDAGSFWGVDFASKHYRQVTGKIIWTPGTSIPGLTPEEASSLA